MRFQSLTAVDEHCRELRASGSDWRDVEAIRSKWYARVRKWQGARNARAKRYTLADVPPEARREMECLIRVVSLFTGATRTEIRSKKRTRYMAKARAMFCGLAHRAGVPLVQIAAFLQRPGQHAMVLYHLGHCGVEGRESCERAWAWYVQRSHRRVSAGLQELANANA